MRIADVAAMLARYGQLRGSLTVTTANERTDNPGVMLTITVPGLPSRPGSVAELIEDARRLTDLAQIESFAERYGVAPDRLVPFLRGDK